jgi:cystathionine beta-synthase
MVLADPVGSILTPYIKTGKIPDTVGSWIVEGIGEDFLPPIADFSMVKAAYSIPDKESFLTAREVNRVCGVMGGSSAGTLVASALRYCREQTVAKRVVTFICDSGSKYLSRMYNDSWMAEQGFIERDRYGDLRDLISHPYWQHLVVGVSPSDKLKSAYARMKSYDVSQLPVLENGKLLGVLDESDLLLALQGGTQALEKAISEVMTTKLTLVNPSESPETVVQLLKNGLTAIIADDTTFFGVVTKMDIIEYLRHRNQS